MKIAVIFPGIGYIKDRPLLYFAGKIARERGFDLRFAKYPDISWSKEKLKDHDFLKEAVNRCLSEIDPGCSPEELEGADDLVFISKSIGTVIATAYAGANGLRARHICFTPIENFDNHIDGCTVQVFYGSADPFADPSAIADICQKRGLESYCFEGANHSLETGRADTDIANLATVMKKVDDFLSEDHEDQVKPDPMIPKITSVAKEAGTIMLESCDPKIKEKSGHANFCTETDERIQRFLMDRLKDIVPNAEFLGEEDGQDIFTKKMKSGYVFVLDPIDGTSNYIFGYRPSVISIALLKDGNPYIGVVYNPFDDMMFTAKAGEGAFLNDKRIMSSKAPLSDSLAVFGTAPYYADLQEKTFEIAKNLLPQCVDVRRSGTAAWDMCCVAMGTCSLYFELRIQLWDYAAASLIAKEAGCTVTDTAGNPLSYTGATSVLCRSRGVTDIPDCFRV